MKKFPKYAALLFGLAVCLLAGVSHGEDEVYYCVEIDNVGFYYDKNKEKYIRRFYPTSKFKMKLDRDAQRIDLAFNNKKETQYCQGFRFHNPEGNIMSCRASNTLNGINFNLDNGRFNYFVGSGYVSGDGDSLGILYGKCDKF